MRVLRKRLTGVHAGLQELSAQAADTLRLLRYLRSQASPSQACPEQASAVAAEPLAASTLEQQAALWLTCMLGNPNTQARERIAQGLYSDPWQHPQAVLRQQWQRLVVDATLKAITAVRPWCGRLAAALGTCMLVAGWMLLTKHASERLTLACWSSWCMHVSGCGPAAAGGRRSPAEAGEAARAALCSSGLSTSGSRHRARGIQGPT